MNCVESQGLCQKYCVHFVPADLRNVADAQRGAGLKMAVSIYITLIYIYI